MAVTVSTKVVKRTRARRSEIWDSGTLVTHMWCTFDFVVFKVILGSFGVLVSKWPVSRKRLAVEQKSSEIWLGDSYTYIGYFDLVGVKVNLGSFGAFVSKWPVFQKRLVIEWKGVKFGLVDTSNIYMGHILPCSVQGHTGLFSSLVSKLPVSRKRLDVQRNWVKFGNQGH